MRQGGALIVNPNQITSKAIPLAAKAAKAIMLILVVTTAILLCNRLSSASHIDVPSLISRSNRIDGTTGWLTEIGESHYVWRSDDEIYHRPEMYGVRDHLETLNTGTGIDGSIPLKLTGSHEPSLALSPNGRWIVQGIGEGGGWAHMDDIETHRSVLLTLDAYQLEPAWSPDSLSWATTLAVGPHNTLYKCSIEKGSAAQNASGAIAYKAETLTVPGNLLGFNRAGNALMSTCPRHFMLTSPSAPHANSPYGHDVTISEWSLASPQTCLRSWDIQPPTSFQGQSYVSDDYGGITSGYLEPSPDGDRLLWYVLGTSISEPSGGPNSPPTSLDGKSEYLWTCHIDGSGFKLIGALPKPRVEQMPPYNDVPHWLPSGKYISFGYDKCLWKTDVLQ